MCCGCAGGQKTDDEQGARQTADDMLGRAGLLEIFRQGDAALDTTGRALTALAQSERAAAVGFSKDVADLHHAAAVRDNRRSLAQLDNLAARIDDRRKQGDWAQLVADTKQAFADHGGAQSLADARDDVRMWLHERSGMSGPVSGQVLAVFDQTAAVAADGDLDQLLGHVHDLAVQARAGFGNDQMGRQPAEQAPHHPKLPGKPGKPPIAGGQNVNGWCVALGVCIAWATSSFIASLIICAAVPLCWCCFAGILILSFGLHMASCGIAFGMLCSMGG